MIGTPASFGFATRNGRTRADNAPEAMMSLVANMAVPMGLIPATTEGQRTDQLPCVVPE
ncbi:hypothetical protein ACFSUJ_00225 [Streptomyces lusitanus]|uniref:Uncharacterized protein n=1 Tax=Streptomyces lusitanus TaxID=68232 RepID=A0ABU3K0G0_9ACTN|nr:hypothetical protein [Streptomyces lusitanus]